MLKKYEELWNKIRYLYQNNKNYNEKYMKIQFNSDENLLLIKKLNLYNIIIDVRSVFRLGNKYYTQVYLDECLYKLAAAIVNKFAK